MGCQQRAGVLDAGWRQAFVDILGRLADDVAPKPLHEQRPVFELFGASFSSALARLKRLEETVLSESIPLRRDRSGTLYVSVVLDGRYPLEMVLDSGASLIRLSSSSA